MCKTFNRLKKFRLPSITVFMFATFLDFFQCPSLQILIQSENSAGDGGRVKTLQAMGVELKHCGRWGSS